MHMGFSIYFKNKGDIMRLGRKTFRKHPRAVAYAKRSCKRDKTLVRAVVKNDATGIETEISCD